MGSRLGRWVCTLACWSALGVHGEASPAAAPTCDRSSGPDTAIQVVQDFVEAWNHDEAGSLAELFAPDGELVSPSGAAAHGRDEIRQLVAHEKGELFRQTNLSTSVKGTSQLKNGVELVEGAYTLHGMEVGFGLTEVSPEGSFQMQIRAEGCNYEILRASISRDERFLQ